MNITASTCVILWVAIISTVITGCGSRDDSRATGIANPVQNEANGKPSATGPPTEKVVQGMSRCDTSQRVAPFDTNNTLQTKPEPEPELTEASRKECLTQAFLHYHKKEYRLALEKCNRVVRHKPENRYLYVFHAELLHKLGKDEEAAECLQEHGMLAESEQENRLILLEHLRNFRSEPVGKLQMYVMGILFGGNEEWAVMYLQSIRESKQESGQESELFTRLRETMKPLVSAGVYHLAASDMGRGQFDAAAALLKKSNQDDPDVHFLLGVIYLAQEKRELALEQYNDSIRLDSQNANRYDARAMLLETLGKKDLAEADRQTAATLRLQKHEDSEGLDYDNVEVDSR